MRFSWKPCAPLIFVAAMALNNGYFLSAQRAKGSGATIPATPPGRSIRRSARSTRTTSRICASPGAGAPPIARCSSRIRSGAPAATRKRR